MGADSYGPYEAIRLQDHSRWRPEWRTDRVMLWWYLTFTGGAEVRPLGARIQGALQHLDCLDLLALDWLHLTLDDIGFVDSLTPDRLEALIAATTQALAGWQPIRVLLCAPTTMEDALVLQAHPQHDLARLRSTLHSTVASLADPESVPPALASDFWPHVSLGYVNRECAPRDILSHLPAELADASATLTVRCVTLAAVSRVGRSYRWTALADIPLGSGHAHWSVPAVHVSR